jgi:hypothetical protein
LPNLSGFITFLENIQRMIKYSVKTLPEMLTSPILFSAITTLGRHGLNNLANL